MTDAERFDKLLEIADKDDQAELKSSLDGRTTTMRAYNDKPGRDTKADYDASREMYAETLDRLWQKYFPVAASAADGEWFDNKKKALLWIVENHGNIVSQGKFYQDVGNGACRLYSDGKKVSRFSVLEYVLKLKQKNAAANPTNYSDEQADLELRKLRAETERKERENEDSKRELDKKWLHRDLAEEFLAALIGTLQDAQDHQVYIGTPTVIQIAGGDPSRVEEVSAFIKGLISNAYTEILSEGKIEGMFEGEPEGEEE